MTRSTFALTLTFFTSAPLGCLGTLDFETMRDADGTNTDSSDSGTETDTETGTGGTDTETSGTESGETDGGETDGGEAGWQCEFVPCCIDKHDKQARPVHNPGAGDITFSEIMANPGVANDEVGEWVEFRIRPNLAGSVDLNNLEFGRLGTKFYTTLSPTSEDKPMPECLEFSKGEYVVLEDADLVHSLVNYTPGSVLHLYSETTDLDIQSTYEVSPGAAWSRDESTDEWCFSTAPMTIEDLPGEADLGTPGTTNSSCDRRCNPSVGPNRVIHSPEIDQLSITEFRADPLGVDTEGVEWLEIHNLDDASPVDLNGLRLYGADSQEFEAFVSPVCLEITAGGHVLVASKPALDELTPIYVLDEQTRLINNEGQLMISASNTADIQLACVEWKNTEHTYGYATSLDPIFYGYDPDCSPADEDTLPWCYDQGTPGVPNVPCPE